MANLFRRSKLFAVGVGILGLLVLIALLQPFINRLLIGDVHPISMGTFDTMAEPSREHLLGTDKWGRDWAALLVLGLRYSLIIGFIAGGVRPSSRWSWASLPATKAAPWTASTLRTFTDMVLVIPALPILITVAAYISSSPSRRWRCCWRCSAGRSACGRFARRCSHCAPTLMSTWRRCRTSTTCRSSSRSSCPTCCRSSASRWPRPPRCDPGGDGVGAARHRAGRRHHPARPDGQLRAAVGLAGPRLLRLIFAPVVCLISIFVSMNLINMGLEGPSIPDSNG